MSAYALRCDRCGRALGITAHVPMEVIGCFKPSLLPGIIPKTDPQEQRARCRACGYVNIFHALPEASPRAYAVR